jgi:signal transduction histidine kinase
MILMGSFALAATVAYLILAIRLFKEDKIQLVYELNASTVKTLAAETESNLLKVIDKVKLLTQGHRDANWTRSVFESESDLIAYSLYALKAEGSSPAPHWVVLSSVRNSEYLKVYGLSTSAIDQIRARIPIPFEKIVKKKIWISNSTFPAGAPILTVGILIEITTDNGSLGQYVAVVDLRMDRILKLLSHRKIATAYLVDSEGQVIAHPDVNLVNSHASLADVPIVQDSMKSPVSLQLKPFEWKGVRWLGAFSSVDVGGLSVISQVQESYAFKATQKLIYKSILFALLVITAALLVSGWLARTFTEPLLKLVEATTKLSRWEFGQSIHVKTKDEVASLARAFNTMTSDIQNQRHQLEANQSELERKVQERTSALELEKKKLFEAQDALLRTTRLASLGELAGAAAHEVLNPINNMNIRIERITQTLESVEKGDVSLLQEISSSWKDAYSKGGWNSLQKELQKPAEGQSRSLGEEDLENIANISNDLVKRSQERREDMKFLSKEIVRVTRIINNMRALSRVGGERRPLDIHAPIEETVMTLNDLMRKRGINLIKDFSADPRALFTVVGDKDEIVQVFSNLVRNALYAVTSSKKRAGIIRIETKRSSDRVEVRITDNGTGINKEHLSRLFEPNFTTKSVDEGTGLGLSISRRLVRAFGGDLELEKTKEGDGTTFLVWFPVAS